MSAESAADDFALAPIALNLLRGVASGPLAQLVERHVYTVDVIGSIPVGPTTKIPARHARITRDG